MTARKDGPSTAVQLRAMKRDRFRCNYCGVAGTEAELQIDHIIPVARGGSHHISNLTTACRQCNQSKGVKDQKPGIAPEGGESQIVGLFVHVLKDDGGIEKQGRIVGKDGDVLLIQLYSWLTGEPNVVEVFDSSFIRSPSCRLYKTQEDWVGAADRYSEEQYRKRCEETGRIYRPPVYRTG